MRSLMVLIVACARPVDAQDQALTTGAFGDEIVATVGGRVIRLRDLDERWRREDPSSFARAQQDQYQSRRHALDGLIDAILLDNEAKRQGTTIERLLAAELPKRTTPPASIVATVQQQQGPADALPRYLDELRTAASDLTIRFDAPRQAVRVLPADRVLGPAAARVEIVEFGDFQCPFCKATFPMLKRLVAQYKDQIRIVWKDFPLAGHPEARSAAEAARCADDQGHFWEYHDKLFANQDALGKSKLKDYAKQTKIDLPTFSACFDKGTYREQVQGSIEEGRGYGVSATPTIFVNGRIVVGAVPYEVYDRLIREELAPKATGGPR